MTRCLLGLLGSKTHMLETSYPHVSVPYCRVNICLKAACLPFALRSDLWLLRSDTLNDFMAQRQQYSVLCFCLSFLSHPHNCACSQPDVTLNGRSCAAGSSISRSQMSAVGMAILVAYCYTLCFSNDALITA
jgi:hypothetical protein